MTDKSIERRAEIIQNSINRQGEGIGKLEDWIDFLEQISYFCEASIDAAKEDIKRRDKRNEK